MTRNRHGVVSVYIINVAFPQRKKCSSFFYCTFSSFLLTHFLYLLIPRNLGPNRKKTHGNGVNARAMNPSKLLAQRIPRISNTVIPSVSPHLPQASGKMWKKYLNPRKDQSSRDKLHSMKNINLKQGCRTAELSRY